MHSWGRDSEELELKGLTRTWTKIGNRSLTYEDWLRFLFFVVERGRKCCKFRICSSSIDTGIILGRMRGLIRKWTAVFRVFEDSALWKRKFGLKASGAFVRTASKNLCKYEHCRSQLERERSKWRFAFQCLFACNHPNLGKLGRWYNSLWDPRLFFSWWSRFSSFSRDFLCTNTCPSQGCWEKRVPCYADCFGITLLTWTVSNRFF